MINYKADDNWVPTEPEWMLLDNGEIDSLHLEKVLSTIPADKLEMRFCEFLAKVKIGGCVVIRDHDLLLMCEKYVRNLSDSIFQNRAQHFHDWTTIKSMLIKYGFTLVEHSFQDLCYVFTATRN